MIYSPAAWIVIGAFAFVFGLVIGSFLTTCIWRLPREESIVMPGSHCTRCGYFIRWQENIPLVSWCLLRGKCGHCKEPISLMYPAVELLMGLLSLALFIRFKLSWAYGYYLIFTAALLAISFIDLKHWIIPSSITYPGIAIGMIMAIVVQLMGGNTPWTKDFYADSILISLIGAFLGAGFIYGMNFISLVLFRKQGMGLGDVWLLAMIGAVLGWKLVLLTIFISALSGSLIGTFLIFVVHRGHREHYIPYGPYLALGAVCSIFIGQIFVNWFGAMFTFPEVYNIPM